MFKGELTIGGQLEKPWTYLKQEKTGGLNLHRGILENQARVARREALRRISLECENRFL